VLIILGRMILYIGGLRDSIEGHWQICLLGWLKSPREHKVGIIVLLTEKRARTKWLILARCKNETSPR
jgi:hypothetical protein